VALTALAVPAGAAAGGVQNPPLPSPSQFINEIDNPYYPLIPGTTFAYQGTADGQAKRSVFSVTRQTAVIQGVTCVVVRDQAYVGGKLHEDTIDWFAQDDADNVWYFGEDTKELDQNGKVVSTAGSWKTGVNGARPGIIMPAQPRVGATYQQEFAPGVAEDRFQILSISERVSVPYGSFRNVVKTKDFTPLNPTLLDNKWYAPGAGLIKDVNLSKAGDFSNLVSVTRSPDPGRPGQNGQGQQNQGQQDQNQQDRIR
jgi:hypothetical protein